MVRFLGWRLNPKCHPDIFTLLRQVKLIGAQPNIRVIGSPRAHSKLISPNHRRSWGCSIGVRALTGIGLN